ncbi:MAG: hypothetical protein KAX66_10360, partial [Propionivibrio sp.]|nr:hypothetical protein [Propionivibrio sp.]
MTFSTSLTSMLHSRHDKSNFDDPANGLSTRLATIGRQAMNQAFSATRTSSSIFFASPKSIRLLSL